MTIEEAKRMSELKKAIKNGTSFEDMLADIFKEYNKDLEEAVATLDVKQFRIFMKKWHLRGMIDESLFNMSDNVLDISIRKMALAIRDIPEEKKEEARAWLLARGYDLEIN